MPALYLLSVWIHILAAMAWIGGMFFLVLVVVPWLRAGNRANAGAFLRETGQRFRSVGWSCFAILTVTGTFNLYARGVRLGDVQCDEIVVLVLHLRPGGGVETHPAEHFDQLVDGLCNDVRPTHPRRQTWLGHVELGRRLGATAAALG